MKKIVLIASIIVPIMIVISSITTIHIIDKQEKISYNSKKVNIDFSLNDKEYKDVEINSQYEEKGALISINNKEDNKNIEIDSSNIDITKKGKYYVDIFWEFYTSFSGCPTIEDTQEWINERTEKKIEE